MDHIQNVVIEALIESDFKPGVHEAYAYVTSEVFQSKGDCRRIYDFFQKQLDGVDWNFVESVVAKLI